MGPVLLLDIIHLMHNHLSLPLRFVFLMFAAGLFHILSMFLPSRLLKLPKVSENMEININSPRTIMREVETGASDTPTSMSQGVDESALDQELLSSTASSLSSRLDTGEADTGIPRSLTPESSVEGEKSPSREKMTSLSGLWTEQSEKVRCTVHELHLAIILTYTAGNYQAIRLRGVLARQKFSHAGTSCLQCVVASG